MKKIKHDKPFEVNEKQAQMLRAKWAGVMLVREEEGKFYAKCWAVEYSKEIIADLNKLL